MNDEVNQFKRKFEAGTWFRFNRQIFEIPAAKRQKRFIISVYAVLASHANEKTDVCFPSEATIASLTGISVRKVVEIIADLGDLQMIVVRQEKVGIKKRNRYFLTDPCNWRRISYAGSARSKVHSVHLNENKCNETIKKYSTARDALVNKMRIGSPVEPI